MNNQGPRAPEIQPSPPPSPVEPPLPSRAPRELRSPAALRFRRWGWRLALPLVAAVAAIPVWRTMLARARPAAATLATAPLPVDVAPVSRGDLYNQFGIYAEFRPYLEVELHAKVAGFLRDIGVDFGDRVKAGQVLAHLEVPELTNQLDNAVATERRAEAENWIAHTNYSRLAAVDKEHPNLVAQEDIDAAEAKDHTTKAAIAEARAEVERFETLVSYTCITAPFSGVITMRYADPGALIQAGINSDRQSLPLVRVSDNYLLRLDFPVSVKYVRYIKQGDTVEVRVDSLGGKSFSGKITRFKDMVNKDTRTMTTEIEVPNPDLEITPGMYATVLLKVDRQPHTLMIPVEAVSAGRKSLVYVVNRQNQIEERSVTLGVETPNYFQVLAGLKEGDLVMIGSHTKVKPGQKVEPKRIDAVALQWNSSTQTSNGAQVPSPDTQASNPE